MWRYLALSFCATGVIAQDQPTGELRPVEIELAGLINAYRVENGLPAVPVSNSLTKVAQWHINDAVYAATVSGEYGGDPSCNVHTWYGMPGAPYEPCCYTPDHTQSECMWLKPEKITGGLYSSDGYEMGGTGYESPTAALAGWKESASHNQLLLNLGAWQSFSWKAMGVGIDEELDFYFVWFGTSVDPYVPPVNEDDAPSLTIHASAGNVTISWESGSSDWILQENSTLTDGTWQNSPSGSISPVVVEIGATRYFRLSRSD